eukprot:351557-Chlamydomonas_euryale.AAC.5
MPCEEGAAASASTLRLLCKAVCQDEHPWARGIQSAAQVAAYDHEGKKVPLYEVLACSNLA